MYRGLRHTAASEILEASGNDLVVTAELLRHSDLRTTKGYVHKDLSQLRAALQKRSSHWEAIDNTALCEPIANLTKP